MRATTYKRARRPARGLWFALFAAASLSLLPRAGAERLRGELRIVSPSVGAQAHPQDAVVYLEDGPTGPMPKGPFKVSMQAKRFTPEVLLVPVGATVSFPNVDLLAHNVFAVAPANAFDLGLYGPGETKAATFAHAGVVAVYCNIHPQMVAYVLALTNPHFARPDASGAFDLGEVPPGVYHLVAWFPFGPSVREEVKVEPHAPALRLTLHERAGSTLHLNKSNQPYGQY